MEDNFILSKARLKAKEAAEYLAVLAHHYWKKMRFRGGGPTYTKSPN